MIVARSCREARLTKPDLYMWTQRSEQLAGGRVIRVAPWAFVRQAPDTQRHALWKLVGAAMQRRLGAKPVWLSTAGAGVSRLHARLDDRPKYYSHEPYREAG